MKTFATFLAGAALALSGTAGAATPAERAEARLERMLEGRVAGQPTSCIHATNDLRLRVMDRIGIVYDDGQTIYLARASDPDSIRERDVAIIERRGGSTLCASDVRRTVDRTQGFLRSVVLLQDFVPYRRAG
jgi:hypothetical protein